MMYLVIPLSSLLLMKNKYSWSSMSSMFLMLLYFLILKTNFLKNMVYYSSLSSMDKMSFLMLTLTLFISSMMMIASTKIKLLHNSYIFSMSNIFLCLVLIMCFSSNNLFIFYIWFEASLIPTLIIIMIWGYQPERINASFYIMLYTITSSLPLLLGLLIIYKTNLSSNFVLLLFNFNMLNMNMNMIFFMLFLAFLVKLPMFSLHLWLPKAHVEAPIAGSMILAAILLKLGGYGFIRMVLITNNLSMMNLKHFIMAMSIIGACITSLMCLKQNDLKSLIAYSSVSHMAFIIIGSLSSNIYGFSGSLLMMITHGFTSSALFCLTNIMYEIKNSRSILLMTGILSMAPSLSLLWFITISLNMALPPSINILSELMIMMSIFSFNMMMFLLMLFIILLTTVYSLCLYCSISNNNSVISNYYKNINFSNYTLLLSHIWPCLFFILSPSFLMF